MATIGDGACGMRYQGIVKKLIPSSGTRPAHGFIECVDTCHIYGRDVFLHDQLAASLQVGQAVSFAVSLNKNGMPQAVDVAFEGMPEQVVPQTSATHTVYPPGRKAPGLPGAISAPPQSTLNMPNGQSLLELLLPAVAPALARHVPGCSWQPPLHLTKPLACRRCISQQAVALAWLSAVLLEIAMGAVDQCVLEMAGSGTSPTALQCQWHPIPWLAHSRAWSRASAPSQAPREHMDSSNATILRLCMGEMCSCIASNWQTSKWAPV